MFAEFDYLETVTHLPKIAGGQFLSQRESRFPVPIATQTCFLPIIIIPHTRTNHFPSSSRLFNAFMAQTNNFCPLPLPTKGVMDGLSMALSAVDYELVDIVSVSSQPNMLYAVLNVYGPLNVTLPGNQSLIRQYAPFNGASGYWRGVIMSFNSTTLDFVDLSQAGTYLDGSTPTPGQLDFKYLRALPNNAGDGLWVAYNLGPYQAAGTYRDYTFAFVSTNATGLNRFGLLMDSTGFLEAKIDTLVPSTTAPKAFSFDHLTADGFTYDGTNFVLSGSYTAEDLTLFSTYAWGPERGQCTNASRDSGDFQFCVGEKDGWFVRVQETVADGKPSVSLAYLPILYSQNSEGFENSYVQALSASVDSNDQTFACYASNSQYIVQANAHDLRVPNEPIVYNTSAAPFYTHPESTPANNAAIFCNVIGASTTYPYFAALNGEIVDVKATANPGATNQLFYVATATDAAYMNVSSTQPTGIQLGYRLTTLGSGGSASLFDVSNLETTDNAMIVSGVFRGKLSGDAASPLKYTTSVSNDTSSLFFYYYDMDNSPDAIEPTALWVLGSPNANFSSAKVIAHPHRYGPNNPVLLMTAKYTGTNFWLYNNTFIFETPIDLASGRRTSGLMWGVYTASVTSTLTPQDNIPIPNPPSATPSSTPSGTPSSTPSSTPSGTTPTGGNNPVTVPIAAASNIAIPFFVTLFALALIAIAF